MKHFINTRIALAVLCATLVATPLFAQEWSDAQKEVWKNVEAYQELATKRDVEGFLSYVHADVSGWIYSDALPADKATFRKWITHSFQTRKRLVNVVKPVAIKIHGNVAIVHYHYSRLIKDAEGKEKFHIGRWTHILMKQGNKWVMIGAHGGPTSK